MKKLLFTIICLVIIFLGILYFQKTTYPIKTDPFGPEVVTEANNLLSNPLEQFLLIGYEAKEVNGNTYVLNAKTIFEINFAEVSITCSKDTSGQDCSGKVIKRF